MVKEANEKNLSFVIFNSKNIIQVNNQQVKK